MSLWNDVVAETRAAARSLWRSPGYAITVIATLALASGANLTMFGIADGLTFRPLTYLRAPDDVHRVYWQWTESGHRITSASTQYTRFVDVTRDARTLAGAAVFAERSVPIGDRDAARQHPIAAVSASYFQFFDARPVRGRFFSEAEDTTPRGAEVAVLGFGYWQAAFGGRDVVGQVLRVGDMRATIVGVAPRGFDGLNDGRPPAVFVPITAYAASTGTTDARTYFTAYKWGWVHLLVRRAKGVDRATATADVTRVFRNTWPSFQADNASMPSADNADPRVVLSGLRPGAGPAAGPQARTALWLLGVAGAVLLIGCANVANLSLSRSLSRRSEIAIKRALGISERRLFLGVSLEAALLAIGGGIAALAVTAWSRTLLSPVLRSLRLADTSILGDPRTLIATVVLVALSAVLTAWLPSLFLRRVDPAAARAGSRGVTADGRRARALLLAAQAMLSVALLVGAGLFVRSLVAVRVSPLGYDPSRVVVMNRAIPPGRFDAAENIALRGALLRTATALPAVESAAWMSSAPFVSTSSTDLHVPGVPDANALGPFTFQATTAGYFTTMGTRILRGRGLREDDTIGAPAVAVVSESMARTLWPNRDALGECFRMRTLDSPCRTIVGIAEDIVQRELSGGPRLHYYVPIDQYPRTFGNGLLIKLRGAPGPAGEDVRVALQRLLPPGGYLVAQPLSDVVIDQQSSWRMGASILIGFGALALVVAGVGLFGCVSHDISQRSREWAIRVALGADARAIVRLILGRTLTVVSTGVIAGLLIAGVLGRWIEPLLFRTSALDPPSFAAASALMFLVAIAAGVRPALVAARSDPNAALRNE